MSIPMARLHNHRRCFLLWHSGAFWTSQYPVFRFRSGTLHSAEGAYGIIKDVSQNGTSGWEGIRFLLGWGLWEVKKVESDWDGKYSVIVYRPSTQPTSILGYVDPQFWGFKLLKTWVIWVLLAFMFLYMRTFLSISVRLYEVYALYQILNLSIAWFVIRDLQITALQRSTLLPPGQDLHWGKLS